MGDAVCLGSQGRSWVGLDPAQSKKRIPLRSPLRLLRIPALEDDCPAVKIRPGASEQDLGTSLGPVLLMGLYPYLVYGAFLVKIIGEQISQCLLLYSPKSLRSFFTPSSSLRRIPPRANKPNTNRLRK
jgi:hypothetical protein